ncbi:MAG: guanylate kinase [Chthoniobacterales bacterium]|nr:guanylate kinase [Chthoniobacterales bacterium]
MPVNPPPLHFHRTGILFVISAPSGAGKTTLCTALRQKPDFVYSVSCTTRAPRPGEIEGEDYHFISHEEFAARIKTDAFLEHAEVHGNFYGTLKEPVLEQLKKGIDVLIDIDTHGAAAIRASKDRVIQDALADVFIMPPDLEELRRRLERRGTENAEQVDIRLANAALEMKCWSDYRYTIISGSMEENIEKFRAVMRAERYLSRRFSLVP